MVIYIDFVTAPYPVHRGQNIVIGGLRKSYTEKH
jgi:hypothetical protein